MEDKYYSELVLIRMERAAELLKDDARGRPPASVDGTLAGDFRIVFNIQVLNNQDQNSVKRFHLFYAL